MTGYDDLNLKIPDSCYLIGMSSLSFMLISLVKEKQHFETTDNHLKTCY